ncbi:MAG: hypothetical protein AB2421_14345 [Thermotaleaceae bacterium]
MTSFFYVLFGVGVLYTLVTFLLGQLLDFMDFDTGVDDDGLFNVQLSPFKPITIAAFFTTFGGFGLIFQYKTLWEPFRIVIAALLLALGVCALIYYGIMIPLYRMQNTSAIEQKNLIGHQGKVTLTIRDGKFGKISYRMGGNSYSAPARAVENKTFSVGEDVIILEIQKNVFYVDQK